MNRSILMTTILLALVWTPALAQADPEEAAIRAALEHYLLGHATGDGAHHAMVFHDVANLYWIREGELATRTSAEYIAGAPGKPAEDESERHREITMVDVTGDAAVAKVVLDYPDALITDYMSLLKIDSGWKIVNKIFTVERKAAAGR